VVAWYLDAGARRLIALRYLPWLAALSLAWEIAQLPLYTLWTDASPSYIAFSVAHCTLGDVAIGAAAFVLALVVTRAAELARWRWRHIAVVLVLLAAGYTVFSEWMNAELLRNWQYSERMPVLALGPVRVGLSPLLQWVLIPPAALWLARRRKESGMRADS
jgi:hypothetical protein